MPESANTPHPPRYLLDSNIADALAADGMLPALIEASRTVDILITQLQGAELAATPPAKARREKMEALRAMAARVVEASGAAADPSQSAGAAEPGGSGLDDSEGSSNNSANPPLHQALLSRRSRPEKHRRDALLAATASAEGATLVTEDASLRAICREHAVPAIPYALFRNHLLGEAPVAETDEACYRHHRYE